MTTRVAQHQYTLDDGIRTITRIRFAPGEVGEE